MSKNVRVLCITDYFLPGFLGGGPIRTLDNMRKQLQDQVTLSIFTRDRDLGSESRYDHIEVNQWLETPDGPIYYASPDAFGPKGFKHAFKTGDFDVIYLNSFFSAKSSVLLHLSLRREAPNKPILLAPRGEFSQGALAVNKVKKRAFLTLARRLGHYRNVFWHASTDLEAVDILRQFPHAEGRIYMAPDPVTVQPPEAVVEAPDKKSGQLRLSFISRISPMKNLDGLLDILSRVGIQIELDIFGPIEDQAYWQQCETKIAALPANIRVQYKGQLVPEKVSPTFTHYDQFVFPTHGENFGHVIFEALRAGTPVLISDQTPWQADPTGAVTILPLGDKAAWVNALERAGERTAGEQTDLRVASLNYAARYAESEDSPQKNLDMFRALLSQD